MSKDKDKKLKEYEKIRMVGKGAFGAAILYRKKDDGLMVIIKVRFFNIKIGILKNKLLSAHKK